ncbi:glycosyltransferase family 4 protein [Mucilaginibacter sp.]|uniref:glycosyltransferase family 4 protein n=1 Tax=Mucilaginibacter sp. TaxID=1882438 RepID=UPI003D0BDEE7
MESEKKKKITIVINGKFHAFDIAAELYKQKRLRMLISTYPRSIARKYGIGNEAFIGLPIFEVIKRLHRTILRLLKIQEKDSWIHAAFPKVAKWFIPNDTDMLIGYTGNSLEIFESEKYKSIPKVLDKVSTHTIANIELVSEAAKYHNIHWEPNSDAFIDRELREYALADKITVPSSYVLKTFTDNGVSPDKLLKIPYAISMHKFAGLKEVNVKRENVVLFVGQISPRKGVGVLVKAMEVVRQTVPDAELWLVGGKYGGIQDADLDYPWITQWGILKGQDLYEKYKRASVFCLLSFEEGLAYVLTEALQCGLPIVATPNTGAEDLIDKGVNGFIVPLADHNAAAQNIINILNSTEIWDIMDKSLKTTRNDLTWENYCNELLDKVK